ncbi:uncharacterized protein LOC110462780 [Mizuhopecten yessoensis]|uniref:Condensation domain-containing protein n=1 Tax=Mizuhopecten yessoensis TaxID=6573 RepID=A0A210PXM7_MIZYE|nr:uncharacterized protein LOC110462780 [Mizuhopecten yessoensis]XP_021372617.1 uncharacterized protein LOC110462780 [Mizuhopecten yessoensis]XP_021372618.1 uncharacterized protein LOC110462780 [Mizuhopecten yessoensis]OWF41248.1 hypothetical protein KP79_PYT21428 [Mizuhopecten yessoensis]
MSIEDISEVSRDTNAGCIPRLSRPLGPLETMYHLYHQRGMDLIVQLMSLKTNVPVTQLIVRQALVFLMKKHPILRMCIKRSDRDHVQYNFLEMDKCAMDLRVTENTNHEEILAEALLLSFDYESGPLWRMVFVEPDVKLCAHLPNSNLNHSLVFAFSCHHAIADGIYLQKIYMDFIEMIHLIQNGRFNALSSMKKSLFLPPIEKILPVIFPYGREERRHRLRRHSELFRSTETDPNMSKTRSFGGKAIEALDVYHKRFHSEIANLSSAKRQSTGVIRFSFTEGHSRTFLLSNKENHVTVTSSCVTAACLSLARLLEPNIPDDVDYLAVPVEIMVNLRRYVTDQTMFENYPGCAAIHIPLTISVPLRCTHNVSSTIFWNLSQQCSEKISDIVSSGKPIEIMKEEAENELNAQPVKGKSPFVICLTNLSRVDDMVKPELKKNFRLASFPSLTRIAVDDMPIFFINVFTLNKELNVNVGYCASYTSRQTATRYSWLYSDVICQHSKL